MFFFSVASCKFFHILFPLVSSLVLQFDVWPPFKTSPAAQSRERRGGGWIDWLTAVGKWLRASTIPPPPTGDPGWANILQSKNSSRVQNRSELLEPGCLECAEHHWQPAEEVNGGGGSSRVGAAEQVTEPGESCLAVGREVRPTCCCTHAVRNL